MEERFVLSFGTGEEKREYLIERVIDFLESKFFTIFNLATGELMFGEYCGELPEDEDKAREIICDDFKSGCKHIQYPDGYIVDDLYEMIDLLQTIR